MFNNKQRSHVILIIILLIILISGIAFSYKVSTVIKDMAKDVSKKMKNTMDPKSPDIGKTTFENISIPLNSKKVLIGPVYIIQAATNKVNQSGGKKTKHRVKLARKQL